MFCLLQKLPLTFIFLCHIYFCFELILNVGWPGSRHGIGICSHLGSFNGGHGQIIKSGLAGGNRLKYEGGEGTGTGGLFDVWLPVVNEMMLPF